MKRAVPNFNDNARRLYAFLDNAAYRARNALFVAQDPAEQLVVFSQTAHHLARPDFPQGMRRKALNILILIASNAKDDLWHDELKIRIKSARWNLPEQLTRDEVMGTVLSARSVLHATPDMTPNMISRGTAPAP